MKRIITARVFLLLGILGLLGMGLMAQSRCAGEPSLEITAPVEGQHIDQPAVGVEIVMSGVDEGSLRVLVDGEDETDLFTVGRTGTQARAIGELTLEEGAHEIMATVATDSGEIRDTRHFEVAFPPFFTPDDVVTGAVPIGFTARFRGTVLAASYWSLRPEEGGGYVVQGERYVLLEITEKGGLTPSQAEWGVGVTLSKAQWSEQRIPIPYPGDRVEVLGRVGVATFDGEERFVIDPTIEFQLLESRHPPLAGIGDPCSHDMECQDDLVCSRASRTCIQVDPTPWWGDPRGVNGACSTDADCPVGQFCDTNHPIKAEGPFRAYYYTDRDAGRFLCQVPDRDAPLDEICPRMIQVDDVLSGRFVPGKEVCLEARIVVSYVNPGDLDSHIQSQFEHPLVYPSGSPPLPVSFQSSENSPPYKDPDNPIGALPDPPLDAHVVMLGTVRYDDGHRWFEVHPIKWWRRLP